MSLQSCREDAAKIINEYVKTFGARSEIKTTAEINKLLEDKGLVFDPMFQVSDLCYNKTNKDNLKSYPTDIKLFEFVSRGKYYILGEYYSYTGDVIWTDKSGKQLVVGTWKEGNLSYKGCQAGFYFDLELLEVKYIVKQILEPDFGCEERQDDYVVMDNVILRDENGSEIDMKIPDSELYEKDINEGDRVFFDLSNHIFKEV